MVTTFGAEAFAGEITTGEFLNTAATIENKDIVINPLFGPSQVGINDDLELVSCLLCYAQVANIGTRYNLRRDEKKMMAAYAWGGFEYETSAPWLFSGFTYSMATGSN